MSYKYGVNGNDLDWDSVTMLNSFVSELEADIFDGEIKLDEDGYIDDEVYSNYMDGNPTYIFYSGDQVNIQEMLKEGKTIDEYTDWYIVHDTNGNHVTLVGDVPDDYLTEDYIAERNEAEGDG